MGWLIDPDEHTVFVYCPQQEPQGCDRPEEVFLVHQFARELHLSVQDVFAGLLE